MAPNRFDTFTRHLATARTRRQLLKALGGGFVAALGGVGEADAKPCTGGVKCRGHCCPNAEDLCLRGRCTSCPSGIACAERCCDEGETCRYGRCQSAGSGTHTPGNPAQHPGPAPCVPRTCPAGYECGTIDDGCGGTVNCGTCVSPKTCLANGDLHFCACHDDFTALCDGKCAPVTDNCGNEINCAYLCDGCCDPEDICHPASDPYCGNTGN